MKIAVDLDGVCYEWQRTYRYMMREYRGIDMPPIEEFWTYWNAPDQFTTKQDRDWIWSKGVELGLFRYGHMVKGARIGLQALASAGHKLEVVTHRPANATTDTLDWVSLYFKDIPLNGFKMLTNGESKNVSTADVLIDDKMENINDWCESDRPAVLFDQPWNHQYIPPLFAHTALDWPDVVKAVKDIGSAR
jgi:5'(3')-deoxyribonucleotidase